MKTLKIVHIIIFTFLQSSAFTQFGKGLILDGCSNYLEVNASNTVLLGDNGITIGAWIMPNCDDGNRMIVSKQWCQGKFGYYLSINNGKLFWVINGDGYCTNQIHHETNGILVQAGKFTHVAITQDLSSIKLYVNGNQVASYYSQGSFTPIYPSNEAIRIGAYKNISGSFGNFFSGIIDEVRMYDTALSAQQIKDSYTKLLNGNESNLVLYYDMEDNTGIGSNLKLTNKNTSNSQLWAVPEGFMGNRPALMANDSYLNQNLNLPDEVSLCDGSQQLSINLDFYKEITWSNGAQTTSIQVNSPGIVSINVEAEQCRILRDTVKVTNDSKEVFTFLQLCSGDSTYFNHQWIKNAGIYTQTLQSQNGCDSITALVIEVSENYSELIEASICAGDSVAFNNQWIKEAGQYLKHQQSINGCDSLQILDLKIMESIHIDETGSICDGDSIYFNGKWLFDDGQYEYKINNQSGCDSIFSLTLNVKQNYVQYDSIYTNSAYTWYVNGKNYTESGIYQEIFEGLNSCDSVRILVLKILENDIVTFPNILKPGSESNGYFTGFSNNNQGEFLEMSVYDRWGNLVFQRSSFPANESQQGWDGRFKNRLVVQGVYVYLAKYKHANRIVSIYKGDITIVH